MWILYINKYGTIGGGGLIFISVFLRAARTHYATLNKHYFLNWMADV